MYSRDELEPWVARVNQLAEGGFVEDVYVVTNNHFRGQAAANAIMLASMVRGAPQPAPDSIVAAYSDALEGLAEAEGGPQMRML
jgi:uncharacterized protein YecE (DUF72 family)